MFLSKRDKERPFRLAFTLLPLAVLASGCAHVKRDEMNASLAELRANLRQEMSAGDEALADSLDQTRDRVDGLEIRMDNLEDELALLAEEFDATVERLTDAVRFNAPVHFGFDEAELTADQTMILDRFAGVVREYYPGYLITVEGFADPVGDPEYNLSLGLERAESVKSYLTTQGGLDSSRVRTVSYGEATDRLVSPQEHGPGFSGRENRRVSLVVEQVAG